MEDPTYYKKALAEQYQEDLAEGGFDTIHFGLTWRDKTAIDHCFTNRPDLINDYGTVNTYHYSDHKLIYVQLLTSAEKRHAESIRARDMRKLRANPQYFINALLSIEWDKLANLVWSVDEIVKFWTTSITKCVDKVAAFKNRKCKP